MRGWFWINEPSKVFVARGGIAELTTTILTADEVRDLVERMLRSSGRRVDLSSPFVDATLQDGSRLHVVIPDITKDHWHVNIRKFVVKADHLDDLVRLGTVTRQAAKFLEACVVAGLNTLAVTCSDSAGGWWLSLAEDGSAADSVRTCGPLVESRDLPEVDTGGGISSMVPAKNGFVNCSGVARGAGAAQPEPVHELEKLTGGVRGQVRPAATHDSGAVRDVSPYQHVVDVHGLGRYPSFARQGGRAGSATDAQGWYPCRRRACRPPSVSWCGRPGR